MSAASLQLGEIGDHVTHPVMSFGHGKRSSVR